MSRYLPFIFIITTYHLLWPLDENIYMNIDNISNEYLSVQNDNSIDIDHMGINSQKPMATDSLNIRRINWWPISTASDITIDEIRGLAFVDSHDDSSVYIFDISDPYNLELLSIFKTSHKITEMLSSDDLLFLTTYAGYLEIYSVTDPFNPTHLSSYLLPHNPIEPGIGSGLVVNNSNVLVSYYWSWYWEGGLEVISIEDPSHPVQVGHLYSINGRTLDLAVEGDLAFLIEEERYGIGGLEIVSIIDPSNPERILFWWEISDQTSVAVDASYAYLGGWGFGGRLNIVSIEDPENPNHIASFDTPGTVREVEVRGQLLFLSASGTGLRILSVADQSNPIEVGYYDLENVFYVIPSGSYCYVTARSDGFFILEYYGPTSIDEVADMNVGIPRSYSLYQNFPNPFNPSTTITFDIPGISGIKQPIQLTVYNIRGKQVIRLVDSEYEPGNYSVVWDGRNDKGEQVSSGIYLYTLKSGGSIYTRKMVLLE